MFAVSLAATVTLASHVVLIGNAVVCCKTARRFTASYVTVPVTGVPAGQATVKLVSLMLEASMSRLNLAVKRILVATPLTMGTVLAGVVKTTRGDIVMLGVPRIGSVPPDPPQAASKHDTAVAKINSLIKNSFVWSTQANAFHTMDLRRVQVQRLSVSERKKIF